MVRRKTLASALLGIFASQAFALGLGDIRIRSYLDQPLDAEIEVIAASPRELASLHVTLAPPDAYVRAGIPRAHFHSKLRFRLEKRPDGTAVIRVTSKAPVREPFLDFLVEANWGAGRIVREYTLLIDPPTLMQAPMPEVAPPAASAAAETPTPPERAASSRVTAPPTPTVPLGGAPSAERTYGPTQRNETLWRIAERVRPGNDLTIPQVMLAILEANPEAFYNANINNLKAGYVLRIPSREEIQAIGRAEAAREFRRQMAEWRSGAARPGAQRRAAEGPASAGRDAEAAAAARLELVAPSEGGADGGAAATGASARAAGDQTVESLRKELALANEAITAQEQQNAQLVERLRRLEEQVEKLHRLLELKDSELARLQQAASAEGAAGGEDEAVTVPGEAELEAAPERAVDLEEERAGSLAGEAETALPTDTPEEEQASSVPGAPAPEAPATEQEALLPDEEIVGEEEQAPSFVERLLREPLYQAVGAGILLFLLLLLWLARRSGQAREAAFEESILRERPGARTEPEPAAEAVAESQAAEETEKPSRDAAGPQTDSSLFTDFAVSGMDAMQEESEADPLAEADVYLAYGRYQQAEELIRGVIDKEPENPDLRVKLLEVLYAARNASTFAAEAEALLALLGNAEDPRWQRVAEMGRELNPDHPVFAGQGASGSGSEAASGEEGVSAEVVETPGHASASGQAPAATPSPESPEPGPELELLDMDVVQKEAADATGGLEADITPDAAAASGLSGEEGELAPLDEVATKLDLARAYMEMGDPEGARSILQEVLEEGSPAQKEEAQALLREVG